MMECRKWFSNLSMLINYFFYSSKQVIKKKCDIDIRKDLYSTIMISGGTSMLPGFPSRLENDINRIYNNTILKGAKRETEKKIKINIIVKIIFVSVKN